MTPLPIISAEECIKALERAGFVFERKTGSHIRMKNDEKNRFATVPNHKEIRPGTLNNIISGAGLTVDEFIDLLGKKQKGKKKK
jgi:predicted RNA binding protein YcfA (HicA-like mRNA interferase family)